MIVIKSDSVTNVKAGNNVINLRQVMVTHGSTGEVMDCRYWVKLEGQTGWTGEFKTREKALQYIMVAILA